MKKIKFEEAYSKYLEYVKIKQKKQSIITLEERFNNKIIPFFKDYNIDEITIEVYANFQYELFYFEKYSFNYLKNLHYLCVAFFDYCIKFLELDKNVARLIGNFPIGAFKNECKAKNDFYTLKEFKKFIRKVDRKVYKEFFQLMFFTGTRPGEAMALKFKNLSYKTISIESTIAEHGKREIGTPKTKSSIRTIGIDNKLYRSLLKLKKYYIKTYGKFNDDFFIFGGIKPLAPTTINRIKKVAAEKAKVKCIRIHDFRHSHATLLYNKNIKVKVISKRLGHSNINTTLNTYIHDNPKQEKRVLHTLNRIRLN